MKIKDIVIEDRALLDESVALKVGSKVGTQRSKATAQGKLIGNQRADQIKKQYYTWLGQQRADASAANLISFLDQLGLPTEKAQKILDQEGGKPGFLKKAGDALKGLAGKAADAAKPTQPAQPSEATESAAEPSKKPLSTSVVDRAVRAAVDDAVDSGKIPQGAAQAAGGSAKSGPIKIGIADIKKALDTMHSQDVDQIETHISKIKKNRVSPVTAKPRQQPVGEKPSS